MAHVLPIAIRIFQHISVLSLTTLQRRGSSYTPINKKQCLLMLSFLKSKFAHNTYARLPSPKERGAGNRTI